MHGQCAVNARLCPAMSGYVRLCPVKSGWCGPPRLPTPINHLKSHARDIRFASIMAPNSSPSGVSWLMFALLTVVSWGVYGAFLHTGQSNMTSPGADPSVARYKAFLFVGVAYFLTAVLAPLFLLMFKGAAWSDYSGKGVAWSLVA